MIEEYDTPHGPARAALDRPAGRPVSLLVLGHGAGGDVDAPDLVAVCTAALRAGVAVARVTQPYRVAGRRSPAPAGQLDAAFTAVVTAIRTERGLGTLPLIVGGRSSGARVACRTATGLRAAGVVALAFPLHPPGAPERSRADELASGVPTLVVNGDRDPFGVPTSPDQTVAVCVLPGERHDLKRDPAAVAEAVLAWLERRGWCRKRH
ncbi:MAG TPA: alpha/beta family hydrolase [Micromonosporaceae bacterium]|nr:alpha/beta family hydrolase [Micromonosporaceae bacterium]